MSDGAVLQSQRERRLDFVRDAERVDQHHGQRLRANGCGQFVGKHDH